jgi:hypothetical protein
LAARIDIDRLRRRIIRYGPGVGFLCAILIAAAAARPDNPTDDAVGSIEGETIALQGPMTVEVVHGHTRTVLRSGNDIRVKSGQARIDLVEGGQITICGPAHLSVLKSGGALTLALDTGIIHAHIERQPALIVYTAQIQAKPIAIGDGPQDVLIGFDSPGAMCVRASAGAVRLEQQLTGQSVVVPQGRDVVLANGQLEGLRINEAQCACEFQTANAGPSTEISRLATTEEIQQKEAEAKKPPPVAEKPAPVSEKLPPVPEKPSGVSEKPAAVGEKPAPKEQPVYQVFMPPLSYDATAKVQRDNFDPKLILLVRRVRVRPTLIFQGRVEGDPVTAQNASVKPVLQPPPPKPAPSQDTNSVVNRVRAFFRRLFS